MGRSSLRLGREPEGRHGGPYAERVASAACRQFAQRRQPARPVASPAHESRLAATAPGQPLVKDESSASSAEAIFAAVFASPGGVGPESVEAPRQSACPLPVSLPALIWSRQPCA